MLPKKPRQSVKTTEENEDEMASRLHLDIGKRQSLLMALTCTADKTNRAGEALSRPGE